MISAVAFTLPELILSVGAMLLLLVAGSQKAFVRVVRACPLHAVRPVSPTLLPSSSCSCLCFLSFKLKAQTRSLCPLFSSSLQCLVTASQHPNPNQVALVPSGPAPAATNHYQHHCHHHHHTLVAGGRWSSGFWKRSPAWKYLMQRGR